MSPSQSEEIHREGPSPSFVHLADYLEARQEATLLSWRTAVEQDERLRIVSQLTRAQFEDNLPEVLAHISEELRRQQDLDEEGEPQREQAAQSLGKEGEITLKAAGLSRTQRAQQKKREFEVGQEHGFHRWHEGYDLRQMMVEWSHLTQTILRLLNEYQTEFPQIKQGTMARSRLLCNQILGENLMRSVNEYHRLQQAEASEVVVSLSKALEEVKQWEQQRGQVLREAVHDLRGHLTAVQGATELLNITAGRKTDPEVKDSIAGLLHRSTETLFEMLTNLLDLARLEAGQEERQIENFNAAELLTELCDTSQPMALAKGLYLRCNGCKPLKVNGDATKVRRIAQNLLLNALKYTRTGGVEMQWQEEETGGWSLCIIDTGPGFSIPNYEEGSEPKSKKASGEGIGLAIVKRLCLLLDAQLGVASTLGVGTTFQVTFPGRYEGAAEDGD